MIIMYAAWRFANAEERSGKFYEAKLGALICGLSLTNQHTSVLYIAPTALWVRSLVLSGMGWILK
jgi:hypothetical protein